MRVQAKAIRSSEIPTRIEPYTRQTFTTAGKEYDVHAVSMTDHGVPFLQFVDDFGYPAWRPSLMFGITDSTLAPDWVCNFIQTDGGASLLLLGPEFVVRDEASYNDMLLLDADQVDRFWKRVDSEREKTSGTNGARIT